MSRRHRPADSIASMQPRPTESTTREALRPFAVSFWPFVLGLLLLLVFARSPAEAQRSQWPRQQILDAIRQIESGGNDSPPDGDNGLAIGPYQIHRVYWIDALTQKPAIGGSYADCRKRAYAEKVIDGYMQRYAPLEWARGRAEVIARIHNGGPQGHRSRATLGYWKRVQRLLPP